MPLDIAGASTVHAPYKFPALSMMIEEGLLRQRHS